MAQTEINAFGGCGSKKVILNEEGDINVDPINV